MKLTERHLREFFPRDMRFTYYVAKTYGYNFYNDDAAERANEYAMERVIKIYHSEMEFDSNEHLYGFIMSTFRYAILNSFRKKAADKLETYNESQLTYGEGDEEYSIYKKTAVVEDPEYNDTLEKTLSIVKKYFNCNEYRVFELNYLRNYGNAEIAVDMDISQKSVLAIKRRIQKKINEIKFKLDEDGIHREKARIAKAKSEAVIKSDIQTGLRVREEARGKRTKENEEIRARGAEALSWINLNP